MLFGIRRLEMGNGSRAFFSITIAGTFTRMLLVALGFR
jgi:hypothetical protein